MNYNDLIISVAKNKEEIDACLRLRHRIFVEEQKLFYPSDIDKLDKKSIYLYAKSDGAIVGTVRLTKINEHLWFGSRLAVDRNYRNGAGIALVKSAKQYVSMNGGGKLKAFVQKRAERLFHYLGWKSLRELKYQGYPHVIMEVQCVQSELSVP